MITVSTFIAVFILYLYFRGDRKNTVPEVIRRVCPSTYIYSKLSKKITPSGEYNKNEKR
jgi:hypothetical protein